MFKKIFIPIVVIALIVWFFFVTRIPEGQVGVVYKANGGVQTTLNAGYHTTGLFSKVQKYPVRMQTVKTKINVATSDGKKLELPMSYQLQINKDKVVDIFKKFGSSDIETVQDSYLKTQLYKVSREVVAEYSVLDIYSNGASEASATITKDFADNVKQQGFIVTDVTVGTPSADRATEDAINERVKAAQNNELKKQELENAKIEAQKQKVEAEGEAAAKVAKAEGEAKSNKLISDSMTPELIKYTEAQARLKHGWITTTGASTVVTDNK